MSHGPETDVTKPARQVTSDNDFGCHIPHVPTMCGRRDNVEIVSEFAAGLSLVTSFQVGGEEEKDRGEEGVREVGAGVEAAKVTMCHVARLAASP